MDLRVSENALNDLPGFNRLSIRAVLVNEGEDPAPALAEAGIIPVMLGDNVDLPGGILGNATTPNLTAILEIEYQDDFDASPDARPDETGAGPDAARSNEPGTTMLPAAFGPQPLAPVRLVERRKAESGADNGLMAIAPAGRPVDRRRLIP